MRLKFSDGYLDYDLQLFEDIVRPIHAAVQSMVSSRDPEFSDMMGDYDSAEHLIGVGLVAAQVYMAAAAARQGAPKPGYLSIGPVHPKGPALALLIHHGANFWKHSDEWDWASPSRPREAILGSFQELGLRESTYTLSCLVAEILGSGDVNLLGLVPILERWRDALEEAYTKVRRSDG